MPARFHELVLGSALALGACGPATDSSAGPESGWPVAVERAEGERAEYERVVLVTIDTLRADHVSCYGYPRQTTPFLDSLAARGVRFTRALAVVSHTAPSHASMLTGVVPAVHGVLNNGGELDPAAPDLAELFGAAGFETAAFLNVKFLSGIAASFGDVYVRALSEEPGMRRVLNGADVVDAALGWLERERQGERFFLWVHLYDPHKWKDRVLEHEGKTTPLWPGATPEGFLDYLADLHGLPPPEPEQPYRVEWNVEKKAGEKLDVHDAAGFLRCVDSYDELVRFADRQLERLYRRIEALALPGRTLWVVTSDHGEGLASHGVAGHGGRIYQEQLAVPLVLHASDGSLAPRLVDELVAHTDLFPTLVETLGARTRGRAGLYDARSLWPLVRGQRGEARAIFAQRRPAEGPDDPDQSEVYALQDGALKYILHEPGDDELFDLAADPRELEDRGEGDARAAGLRAALEDRLRVLRAFAPARAPEEVPAEIREELRDLGYAR